jgi:hypothetical protein
MTKFESCELFVYVNGDRWELGMVKRPNNTGDGYFCWYSRGDTAANTPLSHMHKLANAGWTHIEQQMDDLRDMCAELYPYVGETCPEECKYREECESESNRGTDGFPLMCVAYNELFEKLRNLGVEVAQ